MIAPSKPIALPNSNNSQLAYAEGCSYTDDSFNPASFTRHFLGSPISWRASSFGNRFPASPTAQLLSAIDGKTQMDDSILNAVNVFEREGELCRNYTCCNLQLNDLHALLEHFEEVHIVVLDPTSTQPQAHIQIPFNPTVHHNNKKSYVYDSSDDMELDIDLDTQPMPPPPPPSSRQSSVQSSPSPPDTPISTPLSNYPSPHALIPHHLPNLHHLHHHSQSPYISQPPSPLSTIYDPTTASSTRQNSPTSTNNHLNLNLNLNLNLASHGFSRATTNLPNPEEAFNPYARFASDYSSSMPGALFNGATVDEASALHGATAWQVQQQQQQQQQQQTQEGCVPPALLFAGGSRVPSPPHKHQGQHSKNSLLKALSTSSLHRHHYPQQHQNSSSQPTSPSSTTNPHPPHSLSRPGSSLLLCKPFRCPKPNCNKSYKQANGLKYHMTHGSCNFAPPKDLEHVKDLLERKRREREGMSDENGNGLTRSASLGSAPTAVQHHYANHSMTTPSTPTVSSHPSPTSSTPSTTPPPAASTSSTPSPPSQSPPIKQNDRLSPSSILTYSDLSNISEHDLREVEREAERRLRPYACSVGECQRRYKNMNGLRYHYQHSGDHGAVGLALLASGQHECLSAGRRNAAAASASNGSGSISVPVSRGGSVSVASSRTGTPQPLSFGVGVDVKPDVAVLAAAAMGVKNTSPTQVQAQAQVLHQLQLQQFQQQQMQMRDQQRQQQQNQQAQNQQAQQQQQTQHQNNLAAYHYAHMQRQYQAHVHAAQQQAQNQQQQQQPPHPSSPTHANPTSPLGHRQSRSPQTSTFPPPSSISPGAATSGVSCPNVNGPKSLIPMDLDLGMGLGMGMSVDMGLGLGSDGPGTTMSSSSAGMGFSSLGMGMTFDNGMGMGSGGDMNMSYGMHLGMGDMGGLHHPLSPGGQHHHHHQTYSNGGQNGNGMSS
ncbi:hypothetical protein BYT27DRAFT_7259472 [Phlegmacium glaucopus]|nr:hypothetical protein BYT27DRAFT_7259472 [Phlegmacium glaucopus]